MSDDVLTEAQRDFLLGLRELTMRTGVKIGGCGCCGSPFLLPATGTENEGSCYGVEAGAEDLAWLDADSENFGFAAEIKTIVLP